MWKNVLVPHDFSPCSDRALSLAAAIANEQGAAICLLHASELPDNLPAETLVDASDQRRRVALGDHARMGASQRLEAIAAPLRQQGISIATRAVLGESAAEILRAAHELRSDLIVVGTHGRTGLSHVWLGSVAETLVRLSPVPVLTVRSQAPEAVPTDEESRAEDELSG